MSRKAGSGKLHRSDNQPGDRRLGAECVDQSAALRAPSGLPSDRAEQLGEGRVVKRKPVPGLALEQRIGEGLFAGLQRQDRLFHSALGHQPIDENRLRLPDPMRPIRCAGAIA